MKRDFFERRPIHVNATQHFRLGFCRPLFSTATRGEILATGTMAYTLNLRFMAFLTICGLEENNRRQREILVGFQPLTGKAVQPGLSTCRSTVSVLLQVGAAPKKLRRRAEYGSPTWTRTRDLRINSPSLYQLSYQGMDNWKIYPTAVVNTTLFRQL